MKETAFYKGHRWTHEELVSLMQMWSDDIPLDEIAKALKSTTSAVSKTVVRLRQNGIPLKRRHHLITGGSKQFAPWTDEEYSYVMRRRQERATVDEIAREINRSHHSVNAAIQKLRKNEIEVAMYGQGVRRKYSFETLKIIALKIKKVE